MARLIKRYDNRKLYDTAASEYVSLSDIAGLVRSGETVRVVDNTTGQDLTAQTLTQVILEEGKEGRTAIPSDILHDLLRRSEEALDSGLDQIRTTVDDLIQGSMGRLRRLMQRPRSREVDELRAQLRTLERQLSTLLDDLDQRKESPDADVREPGPSASSPSANGRASTRSRAETDGLPPDASPG